MVFLKVGTLTGKNWEGEIAMRRFKKGLGVFLKFGMIPLGFTLALFLGEFLLNRFLFPEIVFSSPPEVKAEWEVEPVYSNIIGSPITAVLKLTAPRGVGFKNLPEVGELFSTVGIKGPPRQRGPYPSDAEWDYYLVPPEPVLEVRQRTIRQYSQKDGLVVTEVEYLLQYLLPLDFTQPPGLTEREIATPSIYYTYLYQFQGKEPRLLRKLIPASSFIIYLVQRVQEGDVPYGLRPPYPVPFSWGGLLKILGVGTVSLSVLFPILRKVRNLLARRKLQVKSTLEETVLLPPTIEELWSKIQALYQKWQKEGHYEAFEEAVEEYRNIIKAKEGLWGPRRNSALWVETTRVLYSGRKLDPREIEAVFKGILEGKNV